MELTQNQLNFQDCPQSSPISSEFIDYTKRDLLMEKQFNNCANKTQLPRQKEIESGYWRTNHMIDSSSEDEFPRSPTLKNLTSFEQRSMEDHGKRLKKSFENYIKFISMKGCPEDQTNKLKNVDFSDDEWLAQAIDLISEFQIQSKRSLVSFAKKNTEAELLLRQIFQFVPSHYIDQYLIIINHLFEEYNLSKILDLDEDQIEAYASINHAKTSKLLKQKLTSLQVAPHDEQSELQFEQMIREWMEVIFLGLNGVFEGPQSRKSPMGGIDVIDTFYTSRKLIKFE